MQDHLASSSPTHFRLAFLDGLRGLAALFVTAHHLYQEVSYRNDLPRRITAVTKWLELGHYAVGVFIVLSGFSLMIPVVRSDDLQLAGGFKKYLVRRARRILPPYYFALAFSLILICLIPDMNRQTGSRWDSTVPALSFGPIVSHLLMIHNLSSNWIMKINQPMWSVATEWQIYFLFPLILLPVFRKLGSIPLMVVSLVIGIGLSRLVPGISCPWFVGLFAMGMVAAHICYSKNARMDYARDHLPWGPLILAFGALLAIRIKFIPEGLILNDCIDGLATSSLLIVLAKACSSKSSPSLLLKLFESRSLVLVGGASYSLYLIHSPLITIASLISRRLWAPAPMVQFWHVPLIAIPLIAAATFLFFMSCEKPFLVSKARKENQVISTALQPAI